MKTLDKIILLWCAISSGFALACGAGWLASTVAITSGESAEDS